MSDKERIKELEELCVALLNGADLVSKKYYIINPFLSIIKKHMTIIQEIWK